MKIIILLTALLLASCLAAKNTPAHFEGTRESLSQYRVPEWYQDAKLGFFYHWGPASVVGDRFDEDSLDFCLARGKYKGQHGKDWSGQWAHIMYPQPGKPDSKQGGGYLLQRKWYGDPKNFGYKDFIPMLTGEKFDPEGMVRLLADAGVRYFAPMAVHHDGFAMWDSKVIDQFNAAKVGPRKDTTRLAVEAARKAGLRVGVSTHVMRHSWYYRKLDGYDTSDPRYTQLYGEGLQSDGMIKLEALKKWEATLRELIDTFHPDYIFFDGDTADIKSKTGSYVCVDAFRNLIAYYYNASRTWGGEPVITFKRESLYKEEAVPDYEAGALADIAPYKWQMDTSISGWFYRKGEHADPTENLLRKFLDVVSKNGNLLISLALKPDGAIQDGEVAFLKDLARFTHVAGEGVFATRPWRVYGEVEPGTQLVWRDYGRFDATGMVYHDPTRVKCGHTKFSGGDIRYTRSKDGRYIYAARLSWPTKPFVLSSFSSKGVGKDVKVGAISLLGSNEEIKWGRTESGITITPPPRSPFDDTNWPVIFRIETK